MCHPSQPPPAKYAIQPGDFAPRRHAEPPHPFRTPFEVDRHRILMCTAFRRLEQKTQVFAPSYHDHFRTRLTHTLEVSHLARTLATQLGASELLAEAITLAHDLGHPPFGHAGEAALSEAMASLGGFNHNAHSRRVVEYLEHPFPAFRGLNLTEATLAGLATHETRYDKPARGADDETATRGDPYDGPSVEAQIASVADRIAYDMHDLEDAIGAHFVGLEELARVPIWQDALEETAQRYRVDQIHAVRRLVIDRMLDAVLTDVVECSRERLLPIDSPEAARRATDTLVAPSREIHSRLSELEAFLLEQVYHRPAIAETDAEARQRVHELVEAYRSHPETLPQRMRLRIDEQGVDRVVCDYVAGMTDRFCRTEHERVVAT